MRATSEGALPNIPAEVGATGESRPASVAGAARARALTWTDRVALTAIAVVVVLVTLPVLERFGRSANERDALRALRVLAAEPAIAGHAAPGTAPAFTAASLADLARTEPALARKLEDLEARPDGRLRRHGYLIDALRSPSGETLLVAWPWEWPRTGRAAFAWSSARGTWLGHANPDGAWSGEPRAPALADLRGEGWVALGAQSAPREGRTVFEDQE